MNFKAEVLAGIEDVDYNGKRLRFTWNDDVLMEILLWLPAKSVIRFKAVCKHRFSLFSSDEFCHLHTLRRPKLQPSLLLRNLAFKFFYLDPFVNGEKLMTPYSFSVPNAILTSVCNGLMLLQSVEPDRSFHVYNPATRRSRKINPPDTYSVDSLRLMALELAFDPSKSPHYKVVCIMAATLGDHYYVPTRISGYGV